MSIKPLGSQIVVKQKVQEEKTTSGIILSAAHTSPPDEGEVIATGIGTYTSDGVLVPLEINIGDTVIFRKGHGAKVKVKDEEFLILREIDCLAVYSKEDPKQ